MSNDNLRLRSVAYDKAYALAIRIVNAYKYLKDSKKEFVLSKQLLRSGTSIGANIAEARKAKLSQSSKTTICTYVLRSISDAEFSAKISIAYKECLETKYWLSLLKDTDYIELKAFESIYKDTDEVAKILFSILKKTRIK